MFLNLPPCLSCTLQNKVLEWATLRALANETKSGRTHTSGTMSDSDEFEYDYDDQNSSDGGYEAMAEADESMTDARSKQAQVGGASLVRKGSKDQRNGGQRVQRVCGLGLLGGVCVKCMCIVYGSVPGSEQMSWGVA